MTGAFLDPKFGLIFHQMVLDRVDEETEEYVLQNTDFSRGSPVLRVHKKNAYYANINMLMRNRNQAGQFRYEQNGEEMFLANERVQGTMEIGKWYLLPQAYSIKLTPKVDNQKTI